MFILSGLFLEDRENLFWDFWSPFSISFICFSARPNYLKKRTNLPGHVRPGLLARPALISREAALPAQPPAPPKTLAASRRRRRQPLLRLAPPKPPRLATWPRHSPSSSTRVSASVRRRHVALAIEKRFAGELILTAVEPTLARYKWTPRAPLSTHATSCYPHGAPLPRIRPGEVSFLVSGNSCRRHRPGQSGTSSTSPSLFSSPGTSSFPCEPNPLLNFDRESSPPTNHFAPEASLGRGARRR